VVHAVIGFGYVILGILGVESFAVGGAFRLLQNSALGFTGVGELLS
jgi:hypothetical protein